MFIFFILEKSQSQLHNKSTQGNHVNSMPMFHQGANRLSNNNANHSISCQIKVNMLVKMLWQLNSEASGYSTLWDNRYNRGVKPDLCLCLEREKEIETSQKKQIGLHWNKMMRQDMTERWKNVKIGNSSCKPLWSRFLQYFYPDYSNSHFEAI